METQPPTAAPPAGAGAPPAAAGAPPAGEVSPEQAAELQMQEAEAQRQILIDLLPATPEDMKSPLKPKLVEKTVDSLNNLLKKAAPDEPALEWQPEPDPKTGKPPKRLEVFPQDLGIIYLQVYGIAIGTGKAAGVDVKKYETADPGELFTSDAGVRKANGLLDMMAKDKKLVEALSAPPGGAPPEDAGAPPIPEDKPMSPEEEEAMMMM